MEYGSPIVPPQPESNAPNVTGAIGAELLEIAGQLQQELSPARIGGRNTTLDASLDRDWGFDSLSRAELLLRIERKFAVNLPERLLGQAESMRDLQSAVEAALSSGPRPTTTLRRIIDPQPVESAPLETRTLTEVLDWHVAHHGERTHIVLWHGDGTETDLNYREVAERARAFGGGLCAAGLEPGARVAIMLPTSSDFFIAFFGALYAGCVPVPIYPPGRPSQIEEHLKRQAGILRNAEASILVASPETSAVARLLKLQVESLASVASVDKMAHPIGTLPSHIDRKSLAMLQYTSGSTGNPKGVTLTHANILANIRAMGAAMGASSSDITVSWLPLYHDMGLIGAWLGSLYFAAPLVVMSPMIFLVRPEQWLWAIHHHRATLSAAPNFAFELCLKRIEDSAIAGLDLSSLRMVANGSEAVSADTLRRFSTRFGKFGFRAEAMAPVYGLAEDAVGLAFPPAGRRPVIDRVNRLQLEEYGKAVAASSDDHDALEFVGCGRPLPEHEIRIVDAAGEVGERIEGRLQFRGPSATSGYFHDPEKTQALFDGPWLNSGDLAYIAGGDVFITGRSKDVIIRAGRHIYPEEIEAQVGNVAGIRKGCVAVLGVKDPASGTERVVVLAETHDTDSSRLKALQTAASEAAAALLDSPPDEFVLLPPHAIPKTSSGKLRRKAAHDLYESGKLIVRPKPVWRQLLRLGISGIVPQLRRVRRTVSELIYAAWWWSVVVGFGIFTWPIVVLVPSRRVRWAVMRRMSRLCLRTLAIAVKITGTIRIAENEIFVTNHQSYLDGLVLAAILPGEPAFVAKKELERQFFAGHFLKALGALFVDRFDPEGGVEDTRKVLQAARTGRLLIFFPEGTFTRAPGLLPFKLGAFIVACGEHLTAVPLSLRGTRSILRGDQWFPRRGSVSVHIGNRIIPDGPDFSAAIRLRDGVRAAILANCGEPDAISQ